MLIIDIKAKDRTLVFVTLEKSQQDSYILLTKLKYKEEVSSYVFHMLVQLAKIYGLAILCKLDSPVQKLVVAIQQKDNILLYLEKLIIEKVQTTHFDWLINIDQLTLDSNPTKLVMAVDNVSILSIGIYTFFSRKIGDTESVQSNTTQSQVARNEGIEDSVVEAELKSKMDKDTNSGNILVSQSTRGHEMPLVLK